MTELSAIGEADTRARSARRDSPVDCESVASTGSDAIARL
jgi:hypothetical protein